MCVFFLLRFVRCVVSFLFVSHTPACVSFYVPLLSSCVCISPSSVAVSVRITSKSGKGTGFIRVKGEGLRWRFKVKGVQLRVGGIKGKG